MRNYEELRIRLVEQLKREGILKSKKIVDAFKKVPRELFVWPGYEDQAYLDMPLPLGDTGQTISAPHMVAIMLEELRVEEGQKVLEIGAGSGYNAALLAELVGPRGKVITVERIPELVSFARKNIERAGYSSIVKVVYGDGTLGYPPRMEKEIYDRIIVTAAAPHPPRYLITQLKEGGIMLIPIGPHGYQELTRIYKRSGRIVKENLGGCVFVPLIGEDGY